MYYELLAPIVITNRKNFIRNLRRGKKLSGFYVLREPDYHRRLNWRQTLPKRWSNTQWMVLQKYPQKNMQEGSPCVMSAP